MPRNLLAAAAALLLAFVVGCGEPPQGTVSGTVTADGEPLKEGVIRFEPTDPKAQPVDAPIADGKYTATLAPGDVKVVIRANRVVGKTKMYDTPDSPTVDKVEELIDAQFNDNTTLKYTVTTGPQSKDWPVKKKAGKTGK